MYYSDSLLYRWVTPLCKISIKKYEMIIRTVQTDWMWIATIDKIFERLNKTGKKRYSLNPDMLSIIRVNNSYFSCTFTIINHGLETGESTTHYVSKVTKHEVEFGVIEILKQLN